MNLSTSPEWRAPRILVPTDFSPESEAAIDYAVLLARGIGAEVDVLHVWDLRAVGTLGGRAVVMSPDLADATGFAVPEADGTKVRGRLEFGEVLDTILRVLDSEEFDLVVMGVHERGRLAHWFGRRMTARVRAKAPCPMLAVRPGERPAPPPAAETAPVTLDSERPSDPAASDRVPKAADSRPSLPPMVAFSLAKPE